MHASRKKIPRAVRDLRSAGWSPEDIALALRIGRSTVYLHLERLNQAASEVRATSAELRSRLESA